MAVTEEQVLEALREVFDPHLALSIVDLGLVYDVKVEGDKVTVEMTLTAPGCPMAALITEEARSKVASLEGVKEAAVNLVFDPPWTPDRLSPEGKKQLGIA